MTLLDLVKLDVLVLVVCLALLTVIRLSGKRQSDYPRGFRVVTREKGEQVFTAVKRGRQ